MGKENRDSEQTRKRTDYFANITHGIIIPQHMTEKQLSDILNYLYYGVGRTFITQDVEVNGEIRTHKNAYRRCPLCGVKIGNFGNNYRSHLRKCCPLIYREFTTKKYEMYFAVQKELSECGLKDSTKWQNYNAQEMERLIKVIMDVQPKYTRHISKRRRKSPGLVSHHARTEEKVEDDYDEEDFEDQWYMKPDDFVKEFVNSNQSTVQANWKNQNESYANSLPPTHSIPPNLAEQLAQEAYQSYKLNCDRFKMIFSDPMEDEEYMTEEEGNQKIQALQQQLTKFQSDAPLAPQHVFKRDPTIRYHKL